MLLALLAIIFGLALLVWSADKFVIGAAATAHCLGVSPLLIGLTVISIGTSAPELIVSAIASVEGNTSLALGNALGSNITNIGLILGMTGLLSPACLAVKDLNKELLLLLATTGLVGVLLWDGQLSRIDGCLLLLGLAGVIIWIIRNGLRHPPAVLSAEADHNNINHPELSLKPALGWLLIGLLLLLSSARALVWGAELIAQQLGVSDLVIGLSIVAIGTSLPELAASIGSALKNQPGMALGNVLGSNLFNNLGVLGLPGLITPSAVPAPVLERDWPVTLGLCLLLGLFLLGKSQHRHRRWQAGMLLLSFAGYQSWLYMTL